jgi:hypothetical protein
MTTANEQERLEVEQRAGKLGYQIEPSVTKRDIAYGGLAWHRPPMISAAMATSPGFGQQIRCCDD